MHELILDKPTDFAPQTAPAAPKAQPAAPSLMDQIAGVFTAPKALFTRLADTPRWGAVFAVTLVCGLIMVGVWASHVDVDAMQRPALEAKSQLSAEQIDAAIAMSSRFVVPVSLVSYVIRSFVGVLFLAFLFWAVGSIIEDETVKPSYRSALTAATLPNLVLVPYMLLITAVCLIRDIGGSVPEKLAPSSVAFYLRPENPKLYALLSQVDLFNAVYFVMMYLAIRYTMRLTAAGAAVATAFAGVLIVGMKMMFWA
jgi:hypothetical protein